MTIRGLALLVLGMGIQWSVLAEDRKPPVIIFDTDMGNDIDDALALAMLHALESRGECRVAAVTLTKDNRYCPGFVQSINNFYGRPGIPIGIVHDGKTPEDSPYLTGVVEAKADGQPLYPPNFQDQVPVRPAVMLLREVLAREADQSVIIVQVGFSTNLARLLDTPPDAVSSLAGPELVARKVRLLSVMAGNFAPNDHTKEYNVFIDAPAARKLFSSWPTPIIASGFEVGRVIKFPARSIERDFRYVPHHPVAHAYTLYQKMPYDRETWDLTSVLYAVRPDEGYFDLSDAGQISVDSSDVTQFTFMPGGRHRYLVVSPEQVIRVREALAQLASEPPHPSPSRP